MKAFDYKRSQSVKDALIAKAKTSNTAFIAGGTNLLDFMKKYVLQPEQLIDISRLPLQEIAMDATGLKIGAMASNTDVAEHEIVKEKFPLLSMALNAGASAQLRNMATVGGNMMQRTRCGYYYDTAMPCNKREPGTGCPAKEGDNRMHAVFGTSEQCIAVQPSDMSVAFAALDAKVFLSIAKAERTIPFTDFHRLPGNTPAIDNALQPNEMITAVHIPANKYNKSYYLKIRDRSSYAFALVSVAVALEVNNGRILNARLAMGGVAAKPWRLMKVEQFLKGKSATKDNFEAAAAMAMEGAKGFGQNNFKIRMGKAAVLEALHKAHQTT